MKLSLALIPLLALLAACEPSPCDQLITAWKDCWCAGATPSTTRPQASIDEACATPESFLDSEAAMPESERIALQRCDDRDAEWASERLEASVCRDGGSYVCGGSSATTACYPPT